MSQTFSRQIGQLLHVLPFFLQQPDSGLDRGIQINRHIALIGNDDSKILVLLKAKSSKCYREGSGAVIRRNEYRNSRPHHLSTLNKFRLDEQKAYSSPSPKLVCMGAHAKSPLVRAGYWLKPGMTDKCFLREASSLTAARSEERRVGR